MPITREDARTALVTRIESIKSNWTAYPLLVDYANTATVNLSTQADPYLGVSIVYQDGVQIDLSTTPSHRFMGTIVLDAYVKEGAGMRQANELLDFFFPHLHMTDTVFPFRTMAARFASKGVKNGWLCESAIIPFWFDSIA